MLVENRNKVIGYEKSIFDLVSLKQESSKNLNLGCGGRILDGFTNVDKYYTHKDVVNLDMYKLPYQDNSIDLIFSAHSLEHLPIRHAKLALIEWYRVLCPSGKLLLEVPDMGIIMAKLLDEESLSEEQYTWYLYTLFGYQINSGIRDNFLEHPVDPGQFHTCGFTKFKLKKYLTDLGFEISQMYSYDGWSTPSIFVEAVK